MQPSGGTPHALRFFVKLTSSRRLIASTEMAGVTGGVDDGNGFDVLDGTLRPSQTYQTDLSLALEHEAKEQEKDAVPNPTKRQQLRDNVAKAARDLVRQMATQHDTLVEMARSSDYVDADAHLIVGAWRVGSVLDTRFTRPEGTAVNPLTVESPFDRFANATTAITAAVDIRWQDAFEPQPLRCDTARRGGAAERAPSPAAAKPVAAAAVRWQLARRPLPDTAARGSRPMRRRASTRSRCT